MKKDTMAGVDQFLKYCQVVSNLNVKTYLFYVFGDSSEGAGTEFEFEKGTFSGLQRNNKKNQNN